MGITSAIWMSGNGAQPEFAPLNQRRMAGSGVFGGADLTSNFFHFPISTPVILNDKRTLLARAFVLYRMQFCTVEKVELWSADNRLAVFAVTQESGNIADHASVLRRAFEDDKTAFQLQPHFGSMMETPLGLSIAVKVRFDSRIIPTDTKRHLGQIEFFAAGGDWVATP